MNNYSHKLNMYLEDFKTLCFSAYFEMSDITKFSIISVPIFNKDEIIEINESTSEKNIEKYIQYQDDFFPIKIELITENKKKE